MVWQARLQRLAHDCWEKAVAFLCGVLLGLLDGLTLGLSRYIRSNRETRRSLRQAWWLRRRWWRLSRMLHLAVLDPTPSWWARIRGKDDSPRLRIPRIRTRADEYGVIVTVRTLPRIGKEACQKVDTHLANAWGCARVAVTQTRPGELVIRAVRRDPLMEVSTHVPSGEAPAELDRWRIGRDEYASPVDVRLSNVPGISIAGLPGYGKTSLVNGFVCHFAPSPSVQFAVVDGKGGADYEDLAERFFAFAGDDLKQANAIFKRLYELRRRRSETIRSVLGVKNFWHVGPSPQWPLVVLVVDEAHTFLSDVNTKGDKELGPVIMENRRLVEDVVKKGRSVGMVVILATQKATGDAIPTAVRDVCPVAISFAQKTDDAAVAALGADIRQYPEANPVALQDPAYVGVASMVVQGRPGFTRVRTPYVTDEDAARICAGAASLTQDPAELLSAMVRPTRLPSVINSGAAERGEDRSDEAVSSFELAPVDTTERTGHGPGDQVEEVA